MFNPCINHCYIKYGKQYSSDCDDKCEYANVIKEKKLLKRKLDALKKEINREEGVELFGNEYNPVCTGDTVSGLCPICMTEFVCITPRYYKENGYGYCKQCGQKIKW